MSKIGGLLLVFLTFWVSSCPAGEAEFRFSRAVTTPSLSQDELLAVTLDTDIFAATEAGLPDMRMLNGKGEAVPFLMRKAQTTRAATVRKTWTARQPAARPLDDGGLEIIVELEEDDPDPNGLTIVSRLKNFEQRVRVFSSISGDDWRAAGEETVIFDYSRFMDVRRDSVRFKDSPDRHFRIVIDNVTAQQESELLALTRRLRGDEETGREERVTIQRRPFRIERIEFWRETEQERSTGNKKTEYPVSETSVEQDTEKQQTLVLVETSREPLTSLELQMDARNFSRRVAVEVEEKRGVQTSWRQIGASTLSRIDFKGLKEEELAVKFPETRRDVYRLVIDNRDSPPLKVSGIVARGDVYEVLFLASPATRYQLVYGSKDAEPPQYDTAAIRQVLGEGFKPAQATLGAQTAGEPAAMRWSDLFNNRPLLFGLIALLVVVFAWGLYQAVKRFESLPRS